ncbi:beta-ketoacyl-ACP synthase III [Rhabdothermincola sp.]|uniref:beta-ketoacyl-ACP synthase III n=1 Tax=Rhabdothermincola sp. TaxID=2820405 RepID=UPI002FE2FD32
MGAVIVGWGTALPDRIVTNADLEAVLDTSDEWITERTGIKERRVGGTTAGLAVAAGARALERAGLHGSDIDQVLLATTTPDRMIPSTASDVQHALGIEGGALDLNAACSGFVYGLVHAHGLIALGARRVLLIGSETLSRVTDWHDRNTAILFADGAGAVVLEATAGTGQLLGWDLGSDGSARDLLYADIGGYLQMDGREVFRRAVRATVDSARRSLERAGIRPSDVALAVPHQANIRIIDAACQRLGIPMERTATVLHATGNTSSASIPLALVDAIERGRLHRGDLVLLVGFGAGMSWASAVIRWEADT